MEEWSNENDDRFLTFDEEQDRKYGISDRCAKLESWEINEILNPKNQSEKQENIIETGFTELDSCIGGIHPGQTYLLAGRPIMGKTSFALSLLFNLVCDKGKTVLYLSLEESRENILHRLINQVAENPIINIEASYMKKEYNKEYNKNERIGKLIGASEKIYIDDRKGLSIAEIEEDCFKIGKVDLIIVDFLQLMKTSDFYDTQTHENYISCCDDLGSLAKNHECAILILSALPHILERRNDHRPQKDDAYRLVPGRWVDNVIFLYREDVYYPDSWKKGMLELIVAKLKSKGYLGTAMVRWKQNPQRFLIKDLERENF